MIQIPTIFHLRLLIFLSFHVIWWNPHYTGCSVLFFFYMFSFYLLEFNFIRITYWAHYIVTCALKVSQDSVKQEEEEKEEKSYTITTTATNTRMKPFIAKKKRKIIQNNEIILSGLIFQEILLAFDVGILMAVLFLELFIFFRIIYQQQQKCAKYTCTGMEKRELYLKSKTHRHAETSQLQTNPKDFDFVKWVSNDANKFVRLKITHIFIENR